MIDKGRRIMSLLKYREDTKNRMSSTEYDILVIGGGITGAGIARDAALRGFSVALVEKDDFGYGTSSGSSKIVHAGIRYVAQKEFRLVREASVERKKILEMTPHITKPLKFIVPLHSDTLTTKSKVRQFVWVYDLLAGFRNYTFHKFLNPEKAKLVLPNPLREKNFQGAAIYGDGQMDDARLTLEVILSAEEAGADVLNYCSADKFSVREEKTNSVTLTDRINNHTFDIHAKIIVLACGHWNDGVIQQIDPSYVPRIRPTKGIHLITKRFYNLEYTIGMPVEDRRLIFVIPFGQYQLVGTTDTDYTDDLDDIKVTQEDVHYLIDAVNFIFPGSLTENDVVSAYSGLRPLIKSEGAESESDVSRKHEIYQVKPNIFSIAGGKFTTYRSMAKELVDELTKLLVSEKKCTTDKVPLYGWVSTKRKGWDIWAKVACDNMMIRYKLPEKIATHLLRYGKHYQRLVDDIGDDDKLRTVISKYRPYIFGEIDYYVKYEKAVTLRDVLLRRSQIQLSIEQGLDCIEPIAQHMANLLGWSSEKTREEIQEYKDTLVWKN
jgi:glycerol-3-phosphate dehydrogenase